LGHANGVAISRSGTGCQSIPQTRPVSKFTGDTVHVKVKPKRLTFFKVGKELREHVRRVGPEGEMVIPRRGWRWT
jgi:hypothetical protein